jgi:ABC-2 type transport system permease protein
MNTKARTTTLVPLLSLTQREIIRFYRQPSRIVGALGSPLIFWFLMGSGLGKTFHSTSTSEGQGYLEFFFPGTIALVLLFTSIFSSISIIEDRKEGFLQSVLVAPVSRLGMVGGKIMGGTLLGFSQGVLFLLLAPLVGFYPTMAGVVLALVTMLLVSFGLSSLGFLFAWKLDSVQGFHAIMNVVLLPMWLLSGALFPVDTAPLWLRLVMRINPLTYGVQLIRDALYSQAEGAGGIAIIVNLAIVIAFSVLFYGLATYTVSRPAKESFA